MTNQRIAHLLKMKNLQNCQDQVFYSFQCCEKYRVFYNGSAF